MNKPSNFVAFEADPILRAILDWYFKHGGEGTGPHDPNWGSTPVGQISTLVAIHQLSERVGDQAAAKQIQTVAAKAIASAAGKLAG